MRLERRSAPQGLAGIRGEREMRIIRLSKTAMVAAIAFFATLTAFGNITDYDTNWALVLLRPCLGN
jgi:hypothetical protein